MLLSIPLLLQPQLLPQPAEVIWELPLSGSTGLVVLKFLEEVYDLRPECLEGYGGTRCPVRQGRDLLIQPFPVMPVEKSFYKRSLYLLRDFFHLTGFLVTVCLYRLCRFLILRYLIS